MIHVSNQDNIACGFSMLRLTVFLVLVTAAASTRAKPAPDPAAPSYEIVETGKLQNSAIREASGLARSTAHNDLLWTLNDGGSSASLFAVGLDGKDLGRVRLPGIMNVDWEDLASFERDGRSWLLIADIGDNFALRSKVTLHVVEEPDPSAQEARTAWQVSFRYPGGPRDAEAVAVDASEARAYILAKRKIPAELYAVSLRPDDSGLDTVLTAEYLGVVESIPQPTARDLKNALRDQSWHWQPTAMDFSPDGRRAVILTYKAAYLYHRNENQTWIEALRQTPVTFELGSIKEAEAVSLGNDSIFVTVEASHAPLYRIDLKQNRN